MVVVPTSSPSRGGDVTVYAWHKQAELAHSFLFCSFVYLSLYGPFNCISFHKFSRQLSVFWLCSSSLISALIVLSTIYPFMKVSFSPDIIPSGWLGSKYQLINLLNSMETYTTKILSLASNSASQGAAMWFRSLPMKSRKRLAPDVMYT